MRTYALIDLEGQCAMSRRTISDYVAKGLLSGPSHRGRGARYPQRDLDALHVIPRLRTVMKNEYPNLDAVRTFMADLSPADLHRISRMSNERVFETEVRRLRIRNRVRTFLPTVPPERIDAVLDVLTPEQVRGVDRGQYQLGSILDMTALSAIKPPPMRDEYDDSRYGERSRPMPDESAHASPPAEDFAEEQFSGPRVRHLRAVPTPPPRDLPLTAELPPEGERWTNFSSQNVEIRIDRDALKAEGAANGLPVLIRDLATKIEEFLRESGR
jgi:DNA-binding transcriptional MerR regulator